MEGTPEINQHHQRAMDTLTLNQAALENPEAFDHRTVEGGGLRSTWSPDHEFENDIPSNSFAALGERISKRFTAMTSSTVTTVGAVAQNPEFWNKFRPKERKQVGWVQSFRSLATCSWLNTFLIFLPFAWACGIIKNVPQVAQFALCFLAIIPLCKLLEFGGENLALYCGKDFGDLIEITLSNAIEAILALCLLGRCELKLLQATIIGVVLLRLLLIPGLSFIAGGARVESQKLHPHVIQLNQSLLFTSVLFLLLPVSFFAALDRGEKAGVAGTGGRNDVVSDHMRGELLKISRGMSILLLAVYVCSRFFIHNPMGHEHGLHEHKDAPEELKKRIAQMAEEEPKMNVWVCIISLVVTVGLLAFTAELLVESIEVVKHKLEIREEWFGLILLPLVSFSGDGILAVAYFFRSTFFKSYSAPPPALAEYRPIESSIQFILLWTPFVVLLGWCYHKPMSLLFDFFEIATLLGACFLVNYVTADAKTNWAEGVMLVALYLMITLTAWFYPGQPEIMAMLQCGTVQNYLATAPALFLGVPNHHTNVSTSPGHTPAVSGHESKVEHRDIHNRSSPNATLSEKLQALLILYDVLLADDL